MKNPFIVLDTSFVEGVFEPISWRVEYETRRNQFWLARACTVIAFLSPVLMILSTGRFESAAWAPISISFVIYGFCFLGALFLEQQQMRGPNVMNPIRRHVGWMIYRLITITTVGLLMIATIPVLVTFVLEMVARPEGFWDLPVQLFRYILILIPVLMVPSYLYFLACSNMPPGWREAYSKKLADKVAPQAT